MGVICHGLSLPLGEHETIKDCVNVYCEWLTALLPAPRISVPKPICEDPNLYARKIISHLHNLFVPRHGEGELYNNTFSIHFCFFSSSSQIHMNVCSVSQNTMNINTHTHSHIHTHNTMHYANVYTF